MYVTGQTPAAAAPKQVFRLKGVDTKEVGVVDLRGELLSIPASRIRGVRVTNPTRGFLQGLLAGALTGGLIGVVVGGAQEESIVLSTGESMLFGGVIFGVIGGLVGGAIGGSMGQQTMFVFE